MRWCKTGLVLSTVFIGTIAVAICWAAWNIGTEQIIRSAAAAVMLFVMSIVLTTAGIMICDEPY